MKKAAESILALFLATSASSATFTVTNTNDSGAGSLRQAINAANSRPGADTIAFNVSGAGCDDNGVCTIAPTSALGTLSETVTIDGYTQPGATPNTNATGAINAILKIVLSGVHIPLTIGIRVDGAGTIVRGLAINGGFN